MGHRHRASTAATLITIGTTRPTVEDLWRSDDRVAWTAGLDHRKVTREERPKARQFDRQSAVSTYLTGRGSDLDRGLPGSTEPATIGPCTLGWIQPVYVAVYGATWAANAPPLACELTTGSVRIAGIVHENLAPLPLNLVESVELRLVLNDGRVLDIRGDRIEIGTTGEGRLVENLPDEMLPRELA